MSSVIFRDARIFDGWSEELRDGCDVLVSDGVIREISSGRLSVHGDVDEVDCRGKTLIPGLIDAHVHVYAASVNLPRVTHWPRTYTAHFGAKFLAGCLDRGFTTVRDVGGGDIGIANALRDGLITGPRFHYGGRIVTQTGGHGDMRLGDSDLDDHGFCGCACYTDVFAVVADGVDAVRWAAREELRRGASHIKIMASGGIASPTDPLEACQYSEEEIGAVVDEATRVNKYVAAHCHPAEAIRRCAALGIRSIEHASMIDDETAAFVAKKGAFTVPTMVIIFALLDAGARLGFPPVSIEKLNVLSEHMLKGLEVMRRNNVKMGFGTDLLGDLHDRQSQEFELRARVLRPIDILRSACSINAELLNQQGRIGCIKESALADILVVNGNPLADIALLGRPSESLSVIMSRGVFHKRTI
jgi:imidazolonepropionase-like amidohydrolase